MNSKSLTYFDFKDKHNLYIAGFRGNSWSSKIIKWWTRSPYSHTSLILPIVSLQEYPNMLFGSYTVGIWGDTPDSFNMYLNTRYLNVSHSPETFIDIFSIPITPREITHLTLCINNDIQKNITYSWLGILSFVFKYDYYHPTKKFCSQWLWEILQKLNEVPNNTSSKNTIIPSAETMHPGKLIEFIQFLPKVKIIGSYQISKDTTDIYLKSKPFELYNY